MPDYLHYLVSITYGKIDYQFCVKLENEYKDWDLETIGKLITQRWMLPTSEITAISLIDDILDCSAK